jgi:hypothetical protein
MEQSNMPYTPTTWVDGTTIGNQTHMNNLETQFLEASNSFEQELFTAFVFSGAVPTKDGTIANQLDIPAYVAFLKQSDNTLRRRATTTTTKTTATPSTTYYLYLQPDGTWYWSTTNSPAANSLEICTVATDGSGNISTVTDARTTATTLLNGIPGGVGITIGQNNLYTADGGYIHHDSTSHWTEYKSSASGAASGHIFSTWDGSAAHIPFSVGGQFGSALAWVDNSGNSTATGQISFGAGVSGFLSTLLFDGTNHTTVIATPTSGTAQLIAFNGWTGSAAYNIFSLGGRYGSAAAWIDGSGNYNGPVGGGIPTTRAGAATSVPIYTSTSTPSSPPTGSIWIKA